MRDPKPTLAVEMTRKIRDSKRTRLLVNERVPKNDLEILVIDDELTSDERAELRASLDRALEDSDARRGMDTREYLERRRLTEREAI